jgi:hypothetical protein
MYAGTTLQGIGMYSELVRSAAATGACLREYTVGEGNAGGATHIIVRDMSIWGSGSTGNGIEIGGSGVTLNSNAGIHHVMVRDFVGDGFNIAANSVMFSDLHGLSNTVGLRTAVNTGANKWVGIWMEGNTAGNMILNSANESFFGLHIEETTVGSSASIANTAGNNVFDDVNIFLTQNRTDLITLAIGISGIHLINCHVTKSAAQTWNNTFRHLAYGSGTGADVFINELHDTRAGGYGKSYWWSSTDNSFLSIEETDITHSGTLQVNSPLTVVGNATVTTGSVRLDNAQAVQLKDTGGTYRNAVNAAGGSDNLRFHALSAAGQVQFNNFADSQQNMAITDAGVVNARAGMIVSSGSATILKVLTATAALNFDLTAVVVQDLTITVTGAADGDCVVLGVPNASITATVQYTGWVSAANTVTVRARTAAVGENPASGTFRATVIQF